MEINEVETRKTIERINETKSWFFEKINKIDKPLLALRKKERIRSERGDITAELQKCTES